MNKWRFVVIPLVAALSVATLWIPIPIKEEIVVHAKTATLTLALQENGTEEKYVKQDEMPSVPSSLPLPLPEVELTPVSKQEKGIPKETEQAGQTKEKVEPQEKQATPSVPLPPKALSFRREVKQEETTATTSPIEETQRIIGEKPTIPSESSQTEKSNTGGTTYSTIEDGMTAPQFDMGSISRKIVYPPMAKRKRIEGDATLQLYISREGEIDKIVILSEDEYGFGEAAKDAFAGTKGKPAVRDGKPVAVTLRFPVHFALR